jgi:hypothetical protein
MDATRSARYIPIAPIAQSLPPRFVAPKREYAGTGVFLPRCVTSPANETRKKSGIISFQVNYNYLN